MTWIQAEAAPGRIRREWFSLGLGLARSPLGSIDTQLSDVSRDAIRMTTHELGDNAELLWVPTRIGEIKPRAKTRAKRQNADVTRASAHGSSVVVDQVTRAMHKLDRKTNWVLVPANAPWLRFSPGLLANGFEVERIVPMTSLTAYSFHATP